MHGCHRPVLEGRPCGISRRFHWAASLIARICSRRYHLQRMHGTIADVSLQLSNIFHWRQPEKRLPHAPTQAAHNPIARIWRLHSQGSANSPADARETISTPSTSTPAISELL